MRFQRLSADGFVGHTFNWLTVIDLSFDEKQRTTYAICKCKCGNISKVIPAHLKNSKVKSCGCYRYMVNKNREHKGFPKEKNPCYIDDRSSNPLYNLWKGMMHRCYYPKSTGYKYYGGKGIKVCDEWHDFWNFVKWVDSVGGRPDNYTLDRIDVYQDYAPDNCRWVTRQDQSVNKSDNVFLTYNGKTQTISQWASELGFNYRTLNNRINRGWSIERALTEKVHTHHPKT